MEFAFKCGRKEINKIYNMSDGSHAIDKNKARNRERDY